MDNPSRFNLAKITDHLLHVILVLIIVLLIINIAKAFGGQNPTLVGHSLGEIVDLDPVSAAPGQVLRINTEGNGLFYSALTTDDVAEGANLYFTDPRVLNAVSPLVGAPGGIAPLGGDTKVPPQYLPPLSVTSINVVQSISDMTNLSVSTGSIAIVEDDGNSYILVAEPSSDINNWHLISSPLSPPVLSVNGEIGAVVLDTDDISEGLNNLYYTDAKARNALSADSPLSYNSSTGNFLLNISGLESLININNLGGGPLAIAGGGTGAMNASTALNNLLPPQSGNGGYVLFTDEANALWANPSSLSTALPGASSIYDTTGETLTQTEVIVLDGSLALTPGLSTNDILITVFINLEVQGQNLEHNTFRIRRGTSCTSPQVGEDVIVTTGSGSTSQSASYSTIDSPLTSSSQSYTVCGVTDVASNPNSVATINITLLELVKQ